MGQAFSRLVAVEWQKQLLVEMPDNGSSLGSFRVAGDPLVWYGAQPGIVNCSG